MKPGPKPDTPMQKWIKGKGPRPESNGAGLAVDVDTPIRVPKAPDYFGKHGRRAWRTLYRELMAADLLAAGDMLSLELLCAAYEQIRLANEELSKHGLLIKGTRGTLVRNPAGVQLRESSAMFIKLADRFGLSPKAAEALGLGVIDD